MCTENTYKLDDETISYIAKNLQLCILTGTDIVDHLRMMEITPNDSGNLVPTDNYRQVFQQNQDTLLARATELAEQLKAQQEETDETTDADGTQTAVGGSVFEL